MRVTRMALVLMIISVSADVVIRGGNADKSAIRRQCWIFLCIPNERLHFDLLDIQRGAINIDFQTAGNILIGAFAFDFLKM